MSVDTNTNLPAPPATSDARLVEVNGITARRTKGTIRVRMTAGPR